MPELRKRKAPTEAAATPPSVKKANSVKSSTSSKKGESATNGSAKATKVASGQTIDLDDFGGEVETNDGEKVTLKKLVEDSQNGVVLFTYPKASTSTCRVFSQDPLVLNQHDARVYNQSFPFLACLPPS